MRSRAHWLNFYCGATWARRARTCAGEILAALPAIDAALGTGIVSYSKVRAMKRAATAENEAHLLQVARHGTASVCVRRDMM